MKTVLVNVPFRDKYTGEVYDAGKTYPMTAERVAEVKEVNPNFVTVVGNAPDPVEEAAIEKVPEEEIIEEVAAEEVIEEVDAEEVPVKEPKKRAKSNK